MRNDDARSALIAVGLPAAWIDFLLSPKPAVIYGAGRQGYATYLSCRMFNKTCFCLMTTDSRNRWGVLPPQQELPLYLVSEFPMAVAKEDFDVIVAMDPIHNAAVVEQLERNGWSSITSVDDWNHVNMATRDAFYRTYFTKNGARWHCDAAGAYSFECPYPRGLFKAYYDIDNVYKNTLLGEIGYFVLPAVFDDYSLHGAMGPYEHGEVRLRQGDAVLDLGANIGLFSCVAASMNCEVHAFEPTPTTVDKYLRKNASLYSSIVVIPRAILERSGPTPFYVNDGVNGDYNITRHSVFRDLEPSYREITVDATTVDEYVFSSGMRKVDFIKSCAEWCEERLLDGAVETLRAFSPKLALYYIDRSALERKILAANPRYTIECRWKRLFAWVQ